MVLFHTGIGTDVEYSLQLTETCVCFGLYLLFNFDMFHWQPRANGLHDISVFSCEIRSLMSEEGNAGTLLVQEYLLLPLPLWAN